MRVRVLMAAALAAIAARAAAQPAREPTEQPTRAPILVATPEPGATADAVPATSPEPGATTDPAASPVETPAGAAVPAALLPDAAPARDVAALEPGADKGLVLPAYAGDPATALGNESLYLSLTPLRRAWFLREYYRLRGDQARQTTATETLLELRLDAGLQNATAISAALAAEARALLAEKKVPEAIAAAEAATKMAPDYASAWSTLAKAQLRARQVGAAFSAVEGALRATLNNLRSRVRILGNVGLALLAGAYLAFTIFLLVAFARHARFLVHDFKHALADNMPAFLAAIILVPFLVFPIVFGAGPVVLLAWWSVVLWIKLSWRERAVAALFLLFGAASPFLLERTATTFAFEGGDAGRLFSAVREDELSARDFVELAAIADETKDPDVLLALGVAHQHAGRYTKARELYQRAREAGAGGAAWIGLGDVHYALGEIPEAVGAFEKALAGGAALAAHFNLSQIHAEQTDLAKATAALEAAKRIDADACERFTRKMLPPARKNAGGGEPGAAPIVAAPYANRFLMSATVEDSALLAHAVEQARPIAQRTWAAFSPAIPLRAVTGVFGAALALCGILSLAFARTVPSRPCPRCGRSLCLRCDGPPLEEDICVQCFNAFVQSQGVDPKLRAAKEMEILRNQDRRRSRRKWLSLFVPGAGQLLVGETVRGFLLLLVASVAAMRIVFWRGWFRPAFPVPGAATPILAAAAAGAVLLLAWYLALRAPADERGT